MEGAVNAPTGWPLMATPTRCTRSRSLLPALIVARRMPVFGSHTRSAEMFDRLTLDLPDRHERTGWAHTIGRTNV